MYSLPVNLIVLFKRLLVVLLLYSLARLLFFFFNYHYFNEASFSQLSYFFLCGLRFDCCAIAISNLVFIVFHLFPVKIFYTRFYQVVLKVLFYLVNIAAFIFNAIDFIYFKFSNKRTTADFFKLFSLGEDMGNTIPRIIADFWYVLIIVAAITLLVIWLYKKTNPINKPVRSAKLYAWLLIIPTVLLFIVASRGGIQYIPINILSASQYATPQYASLLLNTPFTIIKTLGKPGLEIKRYFTEDELENNFSLKRAYGNKQPFNPVNVVVIIMESFSKEYIGILNKNNGYTPFLDSLITKSLLFNNAFSNGKKSMEGIPAIVAGIPQLMSEPYITSAYNGNAMPTLASELRKKNYSTWFFHGGVNGTMGFDRFAKTGGFENYIGKNEYPVKVDFDGNWGIYDEPFFQYFSKRLGDIKSPFMATFFSLSSHHPYTIPDSLKNRFRKGPLPIHESVGYADHALKHFFETASGQPWFSNTLFVITADHTGPSITPFYQNKAGMYAIPLLFYMPGKIPPGQSDISCQQADIFPSILDFLHYEIPFYAFGNSVFDTLANHTAYNYLDGIYQLVENGTIIQFDGNITNGLFLYTEDSLLVNNQMNYKKELTHRMEQKLKAIIQQYNNRMINNKFFK